MNATPLALALLCLSLPALAQDPPAPLLHEPAGQGACAVVWEVMPKYAAKNNWKEVEKNYQVYLAEKCPANSNQHFLGAQAARGLGDMQQALVRLNDARKACQALTGNYACKDASTQTAFADGVKAILCNYAKPLPEFKVDLDALKADEKKKAKEAKAAKLEPPAPTTLLVYNSQLPAAAFIEGPVIFAAAEKALRETGTYGGWVPVGEYSIYNVVYQVARPDKQKMIQKYATVCDE